ncbi:hypothetical protein BR93DRAFT_990845 [Coniochaeta sp. PMI_546]|nr:hypothetical protein BR93DRAFT_990845 [Coniochaeta sp. PMI_546]
MHPLISPISQLAQGTNPSAVPLVLIHDGGGTVSSYRALGPLDCDIYAISDPRFEDGLSWEGGIRWSFGGLISVEIATLIEEEDDLSIAGLILIDAPYATFSDKPLHEVIYGDMPDLPGLSPRLRRGIWASIQRARGMILEWQQSADREDRRSQKSLPPAVLLRGAEFVKTADRSVAVVDTCRHDTKLGWNQYGSEFIDLVWNVPGSHYSLFESRN